MGSLTNWAENKCLDHIFNAAWSQGGLYVALFTADPGEGGATTNEVSGNGYTRKQHTAWTTAASRAVRNDGKIIFPEATGSQGTITHWAIMTAASGGSMIAYGSLVSPRSVSSGYIMLIKSQEIEVSFVAGYITNYCAHKFLDLVFNATAFASPAASIAIGLQNTDPTDAGTMNEFGGNYARKAFTDWAAASGSQVVNNSDISFVSPTSEWGTVNYVFVADSATKGAGNMLLHTQISAQSIEIGNPFEVLDGEFIVTWN
jgi:hypothetical protein